MLALLVFPGCIQNCVEVDPAKDMEESIPKNACAANIACTESGLCLDTNYFSSAESEGACVPSGRIIYVSNDPDIAKHDGSRTSPFRSISEALSAKDVNGNLLIQNRPYIFLEQPKQKYNDFDIRVPSGYQVAIIGSLADPALTSRYPALTSQVRYWASDISSAVTVLSSAEIYGGKIWIDGLVFQGSLTSMRPGILCKTSEALHVQRSIISNYPQGGFVSLGTDTCQDITINRSLITNNGSKSGGGVMVTSDKAKLRIYNSCVTNNSVGVNSEGASLLWIIHSTIAHNGNSNTYGAINCNNVGELQICGSLLYRNSQPVSDMGRGVGQHNCTNFQQSREIDLTAPGPELIDNCLLVEQKKTNSNSSYIDKVDISSCPSISEIKVDFIGNNRPTPMGGLADYGSHEVWSALPPDGGVTDMTARVRDMKR